MEKNRFLLLLVILLMCPLSVQAKGFSTIYVFGDSLSDQGNLFEASKRLLGQGVPADDHYYLGRFSNGENYIDRLAQKLDLLVEPTIFGGGRNFAYGGAKTDANIVEQFLPREAYPWSLKLQRAAFEGRNINEPEALYVVFAGANDVADITFAVLENPDAGPAMLNQVVEGLKLSVEAFIAAGARDILVPLIPDLGVAPLIFQYDPLPGLPEDSKLVAQTATAWTANVNDAIKEMLRNYSDVDIIVFDTFSLFQQFVSTPRIFGFKTVDKPCYTGFVEPASPEDTVCENPEDYLFWDLEHPTAAAHQELANLMMQTLVKGILADFIDELTQFENLPPIVKIALIKNLTKIQTLLTDKYLLNDLVAIVGLKVLAKTLETLEASPFLDIDTSSLSARARQIAELAEANLR